MANLFIIRDLAKNKNITLKKVAELLGMTPVGLQKLMERNSTSTETIEKLAEILDVQAGIFFDGYVTTNQTIQGTGNVASIYGNASVEFNEMNKDKEIVHLKELLAEKERTIQILMKK